MLKTIVLPILIISSFALQLCAQKTDTTEIKIPLKDYFESLEPAEVHIGDTISRQTILRTNLKIIPYDSIGTMAIFEYFPDKSIAYKEYVGTGNVDYVTETFYENAQSDTPTDRVLRLYTQKKNGIWKKWDASGKLINISIYYNGRHINY